MGEDRVTGNKAEGTQWETGTITLCVWLGWGLVGWSPSTFGMCHCISLSFRCLLTADRSLFSCSSINRFTAPQLELWTASIEFLWLTSHLSSFCFFHKEEDQGSHSRRLSCELGCLTTYLSHGLHTWKLLLRWARYPEMNTDFLLFHGAHHFILFSLELFVWVFYLHVCVSHGHAWCP